MAAPRLGISDRLRAGFAFVILLLVALGSLSIWRIAAVRVDAVAIGTQEVPAVQAATGAERCALLAMYNMRGYALSGDDTYLALARSNLSGLTAYLDSADLLAGKPAGLRELREAVAAARLTVNEYRELVDQTVAATSAIRAARIRQDRAAEEFLAAAHRYTALQSEPGDRGMPGVLPDAPRRYQVERVNEMNEIVERGGELRVANFKAQAERAPDVLRAGLDAFAAVHHGIRALLSASAPGSPEAAALDRVANGARDYQAACEVVLSAMVTVDELNRSRNARGQAVLDLVSKVAASGLGASELKSSATVSRLSNAILLLLAGLLAAAGVCLAVSISVSNSIARPLARTLAFAERVATGDLGQRLDVAGPDEFGALGRVLNAMVARLQDLVESERTQAATIAERAQHRAVHSEQHLNALLDALPDTMFELDASGMIHDCRAVCPQHAFLNDARSHHRTVRDVFPARAAEAIMAAVASMSGGRQRVRAAYGLEIDGQASSYELSLARVGSLQEPGCHFVALSRDVSERRGLEQQLAAAQKMEAIGRLAGGVAHDFNNVLMVIDGFSELIASDASDPQAVRRHVEVIRESAERAKSITNQLLAFSRRQLLQPRHQDLSELVSGLQSMLARIIGEDISLTTECSEGPIIVNVDQGQLQQVVLNLAVNARDAMPDGGTLTLRVERAFFGEDDPDRPAAVPPGSYAHLVVADSGHGMSRETMAHLFEPFFTTKEKGKGTGLGLSIVYGIVKQSDGYVYADSEPGRGSQFHIFLPEIVDARPEQGVPVTSVGTSEGSGTILLAEDEEPLRNLLTFVLGRNGYRVLAAASGAEAIRLCSEYRGAIHLLLSDVVMPGVGGPEVALAFARARPGVPVLLMTGYSDRNQVDIPVRFTLLKKPFSMPTLLGAIRAALAPAPMREAEGAALQAAAG
ncbi:MAG TPA: ATP-binding protein [Spirochaetia bacterium]|nr:ATP-binding protein [Spirochaetia bacterium]